MKTTKLTTAINTFLGVMLAAVIFTSCSKDDESVYPVGQSSTNEASDELRHQEKAGLLHLVELQKFQKDVYFKIQRSSHSDVFYQLYERDLSSYDLLSKIIDQYDIENPVKNKAQGEFVNNDIRLMYVQFITHQTIDLVQLLEYTTQMENNMLEKINMYIEQSNHSDITQVYSDLIKETVFQIEILDKELKRMEGESVPANLVNDY